MIKYGKRRVERRVIVILKMYYISNRNNNKRKEKTINKKTYNADTRNSFALSFDGVIEDFVRHICYPLNQGS